MTGRWTVIAWHPDKAETDKVITCFALAHLAGQVAKARAAGYGVRVTPKLARDENAIVVAAVAAAVASH